MRLFPPPLTIATDEGFTPAKDIFGRANFGKGLTNLIIRAEDPMVIALDGQWGAGKSTFIKMWAGELRKANFPVVVFDAFEHDYLDDAFTAIAGQIIALAKNSSSPSEVDKFIKTAVGVGKIILRSGLKVGVRAATAGALDVTDLGDIGKDISTEASSLTDKYLGELLTKQEEQKNSVQAFRDALSELPKLLAKEGEKSKPLIFIIDELDRCRPNFAIEILERIKHFFSVPNVHFVLAVHFEQLANSLVAAYGSNIDALRYTEKFFHLSFSLTDTSAYEHERVTSKFVAYLRSAMHFEDQDHDTVEYATDIIKYVSEQKGLSLRTIERVMSVLAVSLAFSDKGFFRPPPILGGLCIIKVLSPAFFAKAKQGRLLFSDVEKVLPFSVPETGKSRNSVQFYRDWWRFCTDSLLESDKVRVFGQTLSRYHIDDRFRIVPMIANDVVDRLNPRQMQ